jgi:hypothetical protein
MVLCQLPSFVQRVRWLEAQEIPPEKMGMDAETGFALHRTAVLAAIGSMLAIFGPYALHALVLATQALGAGSEIMRDKYIGYLLASRAPASAPSPSHEPTTAGAKRRRRRRR